MVRLIWGSSFERRAAVFAPPLCIAHGGAAEGRKRRRVSRTKAIKNLFDATVANRVFAPNNKPLDRFLDQRQFDRLIELVRPKFPDVVCRCL